MDIPLAGSHIAQAEVLALGRLSSARNALHVEFHLRRKPDGHVVAVYRESAPEVVSAVTALAGMGLYAAAADGASLAESFQRAVSSLH